MEANQKIIFEFDKDQSKEFLSLMKELKNVLNRPLSKDITWKDDPIYTFEEARVFLKGMAKSTLYALTSQHKIDYIKRGRAVFFKQSDLLKYLEEGRKPSITSVKALISKSK